MEIPIIYIRFNPKNSQNPFSTNYGNLEGSKVLEHRESTGLGNLLANISSDLIAKGIDKFKVVCDEISEPYRDKVHFSLEPQGLVGYETS